MYAPSFFEIVPERGAFNSAWQSVSKLQRSTVPELSATLTPCKAIEMFLSLDQPAASRSTPSPNRTDRQCFSFWEKSAQ
jgi:hypothetical protein